MRGASAAVTVRLQHVQVRAIGHLRPKVTRPAGLTDREIEVLSLLSTGLATKQIASRLGISAKTADRHIQIVDVGDVAAVEHRYTCTNTGTLTCPTAICRPPAGR